MRLAYKLWLEDDEGKAFGEGPRRLLMMVDETGSLSGAAAAIGMSYNKAWHLIRRLEQVLGFRLLVRRAGGIAGGGSELTPQAHELLARYAAFTDEAHHHLLALYDTHFPAGSLFADKADRDLRD